ncbi:class I SAM-dependent methyltransferase [Roseivirga echinicomitans]|uniref:SAM-dependent methyltransferase n=1 Tax=Roseivirga echinicomitans TaxID=296218 RepID=A0A150XJY5_9BACT|nr:class I SAM-dependent methyltransferase [Roseivirga echinicomitans]KYG79020.1 SAM-dependent methyltransferase [Roseivirga echinicomitans]
MGFFDQEKHWNNIYQTKALKDLSWFQSTPETSLSFFKEFKVPLTAKIIDIGSGDSFLVDHLLDLGYTDISVLDISEAAVNRAKQRLGKRGENVKWIVADASSFKPEEKYDFWHDRAAFHFLTEDNQVSAYIDTARKNINTNGIMVIGTFSDKGPEKCSGIDIKQYSENSMEETFKPFFEKIDCLTIDHKTPFETLQNFTFCSFKKA